ncbi:MAG TPA: hypothetical protein VGV14_11640 [Rhodanobacter sp.]|nr:hypothetical protein [Rhodanobacter sp.]
MPKRSWSIAFVVALGAVGVSHATVPAPAWVIPLTSYLGAVPSMQVQVGGNSATVLLDTAGGLTVLTPGGADKAKCEPWGRLSGMRMRGDRLDLPRCDGVKLKVADHWITIPEAGVWDFSKLLPKDAPPLDGSVALDAFAGQVVTLDLSGGRLIVETPASAKARTAHAVELPMRLAREVGGASLTPLVAIPTAKGTLWFELDCGSDGALIINRAVAAALGLNPAATHSQPVNLALAPHVQLQGSAQVQDLVVDGNIGAPILREWVITMDLAHERLWLSPAKSGAKR